MINKLTVIVFFLLNSSFSFSQIWSTVEGKDEFGDFNGTYSLVSPQKGTFSNTASSNAECTHIISVEVRVNGFFIKIAPLEYNSYMNHTNTNKYIELKIKDDKGEIHKYDLLDVTNGTYFITDENSNDVINLFKTNKVLKTVFYNDNTVYKSQIVTDNFTQVFEQFNKLEYVNNITKNYPNILDRKPKKGDIVMVTTNLTRNGLLVAKAGQKFIYVKNNGYALAKVKNLDGSKFEGLYNMYVFVPMKQ